MVIDGYELEEIEAALTDVELAGLESLAGDWAPWYTIPGAFVLALARATARLRDRLGCTLDRAQELMAAQARGAPYTSVRQNIRDWCERGDRMGSIRSSTQGARLVSQDDHRESAGERRSDIAHAPASPQSGTHTGHRTTTRSSRPGRRRISSSSRRRRAG